jgi:DNA repair protein RecO (recombination protein O)
LVKMLKTRALVLRSRPLGERDRLLSLLTLEQGKLSAVAPGARKIKSKLAAGVDYFTCGSFLLYRGRSLFTVSQLEVETSFRNIRENIRAYAYGMFFAELTDKLLQEGEPAPEIFHLLFNCWSSLDENKADQELLARFFELKILSLLGYHPHLKGCLYCGSTAGPFFWSNSSGGIFCEKCRPGGAVFPFAKGTCSLADSLLGMAPEKVANVRASAIQKKELKDFNHHFLQYWVDVTSFQGLSFLEKIVNVEKDK